MNRKLPLLIAAVLVFALGLVGLWRILASSRDAGDPRQDAALAPDGEPQGDAPLEPGSAGSLPSGAAPQRAGEPSGRAAATTATAGEGGDSFPLEDAVWIEGRVLVPAGAPPEPELAVVAVPYDELSAGPGQTAARSRDWRDGVEGVTHWSRRAVAADGSFRVPVPADTRVATLHLDARFLVLDEPPQLTIDLEPPRADLEPELGGVLLVRVTAPRGVEGAAAEIAGCELELNGARGSGFMAFGGGGGRGLRRVRELPESLELELPALPADHRYFLSVDPEVYLGAFSLDVDLRPGEVRAVDLQIEPGVEVLGRVVDERGDPVEGARVETDLVSQFSRMAPGADRSAETDAEGRFRLRGIRPRRMVVRASKDGMLRAETDELRPTEGSRLTGIELVLGAGASLAGRVLLPDGGPAADAELRLRSRSEGRGAFGDMGMSISMESCDADGAFRVTGLRADLTYDLDASLEREADGTTLRAGAKELTPGTAGVELRLREPEGLAGVVLSEAGPPVGTFQVRARLGESARARRGDLRHDVDGDDGRFVLEDAFEGTWRVTVQADGWVMVEEDLEAVVPSSADLQVVMMPAASASGVVLDPGGQPVAEATVTLDRGAAPRGGGGFRGFRGSAGRTTTDAEGRFEFSDQRPGGVRLRAHSEAWAPSAELALELQSGVAAADLVLALTLGGTLTGEVFDEAGNPDAGRSVNVFQMGGGGGGAGGGSATTDDAGHFEITHIAPGSYTAMVQPNLSALAEMEAGDEEPNPVDFMSQMKMKNVDIAEGETTHVVLGAPPADPVRLHGRVTEGGVAVERGTLMAIAEGRSIVEAWKPARVGAGGAYEMILDEPGRYVLLYQAEAFQEGGIEFPLTVPEESEHRFDVELPGGRISGLVLGPDGAPLDGVSVSLSRENGARAFSMFGQGTRERSADGGRFAFERLKPGTYALRAGGARNPFGGGGGGGSYGAVIVSGVELAEGGAVDGIELTLERPGALTGLVRSTSGDPVVGATVFVRDAVGRPVEGFSTVATGEDGRFRHANLAPGEYTASARAEGAVSGESGVARVREGDETEVELVLEDGVLLRVVVEEPDGAPARVAVRVVDEAGREYQDMRSFESLQTTFNEGLSTSEIRIGPVPAGTYHVTVTAEDGRTEERKLSLRASRSERKLRLRLDE